MNYENNPSVQVNAGNTSETDSVSPSSQLTPRWGNGGGSTSDTTAVFILLLCLFVLFLVTGRIMRFWNTERGTQLNHSRHSRHSRHARTQEFIESMLLLKKVLGFHETEEKNGETKKEGSLEKGQAVKSDLVLYPGTDDGLDVCPICLVEYKEGDEICWSHNRSCTHHFHAECAIAWFAKHSECPICRANYLVEPSTAKDEENQEQQEDEQQPADQTATIEPQAEAEEELEDEEAAESNV